MSTNEDEESFTIGGLVRKIYRLEREHLRVATALDARMDTVEKDIDDIPKQIAELAAQIREQIKDLVTKSRFYPVELIAYGLVAGVMLTVLGAVLGKVLIR